MPRALALALAAASSAAPSARVAGPPATVYDFYTQHCPPLPQPGCAQSIAEGCDADIADAPLRLFRRSGGDGRVVALASVDLGSRALSGAGALALAHECRLYANSTRLAAFSLYANYEWVHSSWYFSANNTAVALTHMEWDCKGPETCPYYGQGYSFFSGVTLHSSPDGGATWVHALAPPAHIVAVSPVRWTEALGAAGASFGFRSPSSIAAGRGAQAGFFFATVTAGWGRGAFEGQVDGACMMRTRDLTDPRAWRAWGGAAFNVSLAASPWAGSPPPDPALHRCVPFTNTTYGSLVFSTVYNSYMYFGTRDGDDAGGWQFLLSPDLESWSAPKIVDAAGWIAPAGNASIARTGANLTGRFVQRADRGADPQVWYEDEARAVKRRVGACEPCPGVDACGAIVPIPDAEFDALAERPDFSCGPLYNTSGFSAFYYPTLVDAASPSDNFDEVGANATLFLVAQRCVNARADGAGGVACSPFDVNGELVRDVVRVPVVFAGGAGGEGARGGMGNP